MVHIYSSDRLSEQLFNILEDADERDRVYLYRMEGNKKIKPAVYIGPPFRGLEQYIRDNFMDPSKGRYAMFCIMIRRGEKMRLSGTISFLLPLNQRRA
jgi:hypothetical protein